MANHGYLDRQFEVLVIIYATQTTRTGNFAKLDQSVQYSIVKKYVCIIGFSFTVFYSEIVSEIDKGNSIKYKGQRDFPFLPLTIFI